MFRNSKKQLEISFAVVIVFKRKCLKKLISKKNWKKGSEIFKKCSKIIFIFWKLLKIVGIYLMRSLCVCNIEANSLRRRLHYSGISDRGVCTSVCLCLCCLRVPWRISKHMQRINWAQIGFKLFWTGQGNN